MLTNQRSVLTMMTTQYRGQEAKGRIEEVGSEDADEDGGHGGHPAPVMSQSEDSILKIDQSAPGQQPEQRGAYDERDEGVADGKTEQGDGDLVQQ